MKATRRSIKAHDSNKRNYSVKRYQRDEDVNDNVPNTYGVPLEEEQAGSVSGEIGDLRGHANACRRSMDDGNPQTRQWSVRVN